MHYTFVFLSVFFFVKWRKDNTAAAFAAAAVAAGDSTNSSSFTDNLRRVVSKV